MPAVTGNSTDSLINDPLSIVQGLFGRDSARNNGTDDEFGVPQAFMKALENPDVSSLVRLVNLVFTDL